MINSITKLSEFLGNQIEFESDHAPVYLSVFLTTGTVRNNLGIHDSTASAICLRGNVRPAELLLAQSTLMALARAAIPSDHAFEIGDISFSGKIDPGFHQYVFIDSSKSKDERLEPIQIVIDNVHNLASSKPFNSHQVMDEYRPIMEGLLTKLVQEEFEIESIYQNLVCTEIDYLTFLNNRLLLAIAQKIDQAIYNTCKDFLLSCRSEENRVFAAYYTQRVLKTLHLNWNNISEIVNATTPGKVHISNPSRWIRSDVLQKYIPDIPGNLISRILRECNLITESRRCSLPRELPGSFVTLYRMNENALSDIETFLKGLFKTKLF